MLEADDRAKPRGFEDLPLFAAPARPAAPDPRQAALDALLAALDGRPSRRTVAARGAGGALRAQAKGRRRDISRSRARPCAYARHRAQNKQAMREAMKTCSAAWSCSAAAAGASPGQRSAQSFPDRTVTIVVTSAAGALTDVLTRAVAPAAVAEVGPDHRRREPRRRRPHHRGDRGDEGRAATATRCSPRKPASSPASRTSTPRASCPTTRQRDFVPVAGYASIPVALLVQSLGAGEVDRRADRARQGKSPAA